MSNLAEKEMKIADLVRTSMAILLKQDLITPEMVVKLMDKKYSKNTFDLNYPFLKKVLMNRSISEQSADHNGQLRYWVKPIITVHGERYIITNHWIEKSRTKLKVWLKNLVP